MRKTRTSPWATVLFWGIIAVAAVMGYFFWEAWNDSQQQLAMLERIKNERTKEVDALQHRLENNKEYLDLVLKDPPTFFRNEARQRLGYVSTGEIVIKVEPPPPARPTLTVPRR